MTTPLSTPIRQAKLGIASTKSLPLTNEYKKLLNEQYQRLWVKHQQDLDLIDDIRSYVKARLSIEKEYTSALSKLSKQHSSHIAKKFTLLSQCDPPIDENAKSQEDLEASDSRLQKRLANNGMSEPDSPSSLYKVWSEHINRLLSTSKNRADQFDQLLMVADKLKDIRSHKASIGKKCLDTHLKRIHEDVLVSMLDVEKTRKLYNEDESQAKKARENEEKIKKKRSGLLTKFTDLQAKKEKTSAQREANDIQSTQARNDYIMALAAGNAHLEHYYKKDLSDFIQLIDDGVLDHCKIFMATLSECDINSLKDTLTSSQYWSKMINLTGSQKTNTIFLECSHSKCLRDKTSLSFEPCNDDPVRSISLEYNADYALQYEIDKWFTWFKKECRNLSQLVHQLQICQKAFTEGKKSIELNGQMTEDLESKIIDLRQQIRKSEAAKLKAQARLKVIKEGGMQIEEWSAVESEIRADMARAQEEMEAKKAREAPQQEANDSQRNEMSSADQQSKSATGYVYEGDEIQLRVSKDSDDSDAVESNQNLASVSRSNSNLMQKQQNAISGYSVLTDPSLVWQDDFSNAWGGKNQNPNYNVVITDSNNNTSQQKNSNQTERESNRYDLLGATDKQAQQSGNPQYTATSTTVQSSSPLSAIMDGVQTSSSPYQGMMSEAYKSDFECDYNRGGQFIRSAASSAEPFNTANQQNFESGFNDTIRRTEGPTAEVDISPEVKPTLDAERLLGKSVLALYTFEKTNEDDLAFEEGEKLTVIGINDANWVKARIESTGEEGYIPTSYVKELEDQQQEEDPFAQQGDIESEPFSSLPATQILQDDTENRTSLRCRALYDYEPDIDTFEEDGLPHLALVQGETMKVLNQGEDDGWWLVEKENTGVRGHVPSMLVEEVSDDVEGDHDGGDDEEAEISEYSDNDDDEDGARAMPDFEPPDLPSLDTVNNPKGFDQEAQVDTGPNQLDNEVTPNEVQHVKKEPASLVPTSFIIIEPTPEVESRMLEDSLAPDAAECPLPARPTEDNPTSIISGSVPPKDVSFVVVNENFVLEGPTRKPNIQTGICKSTSIIEDAQEEPTNDKETRNSQEESTEAAVSTKTGSDAQITPSVVVDRYEDTRDSSNDLDTSEHLEQDQTEEDSSQGNSEVPQTVTTSDIPIDDRPLLRQQAEILSKQIVAEALSRAPAEDVVSPSDDLK